MNELIAILFLSREVAHRAHLKAKGKGSHAAHVALRGFYETIGEKADSIAEAYQGKYNTRLDIPYLTANNTTAPIAAVLRQHMDKVESLRYTAELKTNTAIQNRIDEAVGTYMDALYQLSLE